MEGPGLSLLEPLRAGADPRPGWIRTQWNKPALTLAPSLAVGIVIPMARTKVESSSEGFAKVRCTVVSPAVSDGAMSYFSSSAPDTAGFAKSSPQPPTVIRAPLEKAPSSYPPAQSLTTLPCTVTTVYCDPTGGHSSVLNEIPMLILAAPPEYGVSRGTSTASGVVE